MYTCQSLISSIANLLVTEQLIFVFNLAFFSFFSVAVSAAVASSVFSVAFVSLG